MKTIETTKWVGTAALIAATLARATHHNGIDINLSLIGVACWFIVGVSARDKPLWIVNAFSVVVLGASALGYVH
jgi:hypothetical protein